MSLLGDIRSYLGHREIEKIIAEGRRRPVIPDMEKLRSILILFRSGVRAYDCSVAEDKDPEENAYIQKLSNEFRKKGVHVYAWGYVEEKKETQTPRRKEYRLFGKGELKKINGLPTKELTEEFDAVGIVDLVVDLDLENKAPLDFLLARSRGRLKVSGMKSYANISDFVIKLEKDMNKPQVFYEQAMFYLNSIKGKND